MNTREIYLGRIRIMEGENQLKVSITSLSSMDGRAFFGLDLPGFSN